MGAEEAEVIGFLVVTAAALLLCGAMALAYRRARRRSIEHSYQRAVADIRRSNNRAARDAQKRERRQPDIYPEPWQ